MVTNAEERALETRVVAGNSICAARYKMALRLSRQVCSEEYVHKQKKTYASPSQHARQPKRNLHLDAPHMIVAPCISQIH